MKNYVAIMDWTPQNTVAKYADFDTQAEADAHILAHAGRFPSAFVVPLPAGTLTQWVVDGPGKSISIVLPDIADVKAEKQKQMKREAMAAYKAHADSDIMLTNTALNTYKAALKSHLTAEIAAVDAMADVQAIESHLTDWPQP